MKKHKTYTLILSTCLLLCNCVSKKIIQTDIGVTYTPIPKKIVTTAIQKKYSKLLDVDPLEIKNEKLYKAIDDWLTTPYKLGGTTKKGIDCSSFTQLIYTKAYKKYIERTAEAQFDSEETDKFSGQDNLKEGDLLFFTTSAYKRDRISHVGIFLKNDYFVHATNHLGKSGYRGVKISKLKDTFWQSRFIAGGRKLELNSN